jgi:putative transposase
VSLQGSLGVERMCLLVGVSRTGFYRYLRAQDPWDEEMELRSEIQRVALEHQGRYGYRRMTAELRRRGMLVNHKRVARLLREDSLVGTNLESSRISTDAQEHGEIYVNLANRMSLTGVNQLWVADITFVRLKREFVYLAIILDRFSRKVVGWNLDRTLTSRLPLVALEKALEERRPGPGLVHHSDRGAQYAHSGYLRMLHKHGAIPSVSRPGSSCDNANCESFFRTLKREEVDAKDYRDLDDLRLNISAFIDCYYNRIRLHSALGYRPPEEFERLTVSSDAASISSATKLDLAATEGRLLSNSHSRPTVTNWIVSTRGSFDQSSCRQYG